MKLYRFTFFVGCLNLIVPFLGISFIYKQYIMISVAVFTILFALIARTVQKEKEYFVEQKVEQKSEVTNSTSEYSQKIEDVIEMEDTSPSIVMSDVKPRKRGRKTKVLVSNISKHD